MSYPTSGIEQFQKATSVVITELRVRIHQLESRLHLQEKIEDGQPTIGDFHKSQEDVITLGKRIQQLEGELSMMREQCRVSDEAFNFHLKRANELMNRCNSIEGQNAQHLAVIEKAKVLAETASYFECWDSEAQKPYPFKDSLAYSEWKSAIAALENGKS